MPTTCTPFAPCGGGEALQRRHFLDAGAAPAGPEVDQDRPAGVGVGHVDRSAVEIRQRDVRHAARRVRRRPRPSARRARTRPSRRLAARAGRARCATAGPGPERQQAGDDAERAGGKRDQHDFASSCFIAPRAAARAFDERVGLLEADQAQFAPFRAVDEEQRRRRTDDARSAASAPGRRRRWR